MASGRRDSLAVLVPILVTALAGPVWAAPGSGELPKWEVGIAAGAGWTPHYPAADEGGGAVAGAPYLIYRGRRLRLGDNGWISGRMIKTKRIDLSVSIDGSLPANSEDNAARAGMPDLDLLLEIGPQLIVTLADRPDIDSVKLKLPLRGVASTDFHNLEYQGLVFQPRLSYGRENLFGAADLSGSVSIGPAFASERLMDYFYEVAPQFATAQRPAYDARRGYLGSNMRLGLTYRVSERFKISLGTQFSYYGGAANSDSPLFRSRTGIAAGIGFVWKAWMSKTMVPD